MFSNKFPYFRFFLLAAFSLVVVACGGGGGGSDNSTPPPVDTPAPPLPPVPDPDSSTVSKAEAARFLSQATFGSTSAAIDAVAVIGPERWFIDEIDKPASLHLQNVLDTFADDGSFMDEEGDLLAGVRFAPSNSFWQTAIEADDQLRQRMAFALSQILVVSRNSNLSEVPQTMAAYMDVLTEGALGNYRDLIEEVTYSPAMSIYLTYLRNVKAEPETGRVPDENYARELMQLFTIGLVELNQDGTSVQGTDGDIELFDNTDITGLAKVFTGLSFSGTGFLTGIRNLPLTAYYTRLSMFDAFHSEEEKTFLGTTIPANTDGETSIEMALDTIFAHPNIGPFIGRQLIQRFVTSHPSPAYVSRVANAFDSGTYELPSGTSVGSTGRGDLTATLAAILFDEEAHNASSTDNVQFGKLREPVIRFTHWARAFEVNSANASNEAILLDTSDQSLLGQHPYSSASVFNFYRPGYIAPGTETGDAGLTAPELQISSAATIIGYPNFITIFAFDLSPQRNPDNEAAYRADYEVETGLASDNNALLDHLDLLLTHDTLQEETRSRIIAALSELSGDDVESRSLRARLASVLVMTSPEYIVLR